MSSQIRQFRALVYQLKELEDALRNFCFTEGADDVARAARLFGPSPVADFLDESRLVLTNVLLGERELPEELLALVLDVIAVIDQRMRELNEGT